MSYASSLQQPLQHFVQPVPIPTFTIPQAPNPPFYEQMHNNRVVSHYFTYISMQYNLLFTYSYLQILIVKYQ
jgi:hypothetical protein